MTDLYLMALVNVGLCVAIVVISVCRLNTMQGSVLLRVQSEYAGYIGGAIASAAQPWWNEWPQWGSLAIAAALLLGLIFSGHAWRKDKPPASATAPAPLSDFPEITP
ncbi:hypothetical protein NWF24_17570 [Variovorax paradoxus]|uniref:hypothetical protein n=1 Tax=Variovorax paradoxus TaxID=34073 RepID=UPI0021AC7266|nr:hypothetical protein [Variovorax paradoxus]UVH54656.1 hypothetical protein NWF24_17570 [Variovorax paradoxus]